MKKTRDFKVPKDKPKVRYAGQKGSAQNALRYELYRYAHERLEEACEQGMLFEVIAICDMLITDRMEAYCQYLLHDDDLQFETMSIAQSLAALGTAISDKIPPEKKPPEWKPLQQRLERFAEARNFALHSFVLVKNSAPTSSLEERINFVEDAAEDGLILVREVSAFVSKHMKFDD